MIRYVQTDQNCLALTFDDGPDDTYTPRVLDILEHYDVPAVFFCVGSKVEQHSNVIERMVRGGHTVANHSWDHPFLTKEAPDDVHWQLEATSEAIAKIIGRRPLLFRPPYGDVDNRVAKQATSLGYQLILWDVDSVDWSGIPGPQIAANVLPHLHPGAILLHHSAGHVSGTVEALPYLIEVSHAMGYRFGRLEELMGVPAYA